MVEMLLIVIALSLFSIDSKLPSPQKCPKPGDEDYEYSPFDLFNKEDK